MVTESSGRRRRWHRREQAAIYVNSVGSRGFYAGVVDFHGGEHIAAKIRSGRRGIKLLWVDGSLFKEQFMLVQRSRSRLLSNNSGEISLITIDNKVCREMILKAV